MNRRTLTPTLISICALAALQGCGDGDDAAQALPAPAETVPLAQFSDALPPQIADGAIAPGGKCNMETLNGAHWGTTVPVVERTSPINIVGWGVVDAATKVGAEATYVRLGSADGKAQFALAGKTERPDVGKYFSDPWLDGSGYELNAEPGTLPAGDYTATIVMVQGAHATLCDSGRRLTIR